MQLHSEAALYLSPLIHWFLRELFFVVLSAIFQLPLPHHWNSSCLWPHFSDWRPTGKIFLAQKHPLLNLKPPVAERALSSWHRPSSTVPLGFAPSLKPSEFRASGPALFRSGRGAMSFVSPASAPRRVPKPPPGGATSPCSGLTVMQTWTEGSVVLRLR